MPENKKIKLNLPFKNSIFVKKRVFDKFFKEARDIISRPISLGGKPRICPKATFNKL